MEDNIYKEYLFRKLTDFRRTSYSEKYNRYKKGKDSFKISRGVYPKYARL